MRNIHIKKKVYSLIYKTHNIANGVIDLFFPLDTLDGKIKDLKAEGLSSRIKIKNPSKSSTSLFQYKDPLIRRMLWLLKYKNNQHTIEIFGTIIGEYLTDTITEALLYENFTNPIIAYVPLTQKRERERGFNQVERVVKYITQRYLWLTSVDKKALTKVRETPPQTSLKRKERLLNLKDAFRAEKSVFSKRNVILLDDVMTTGSTLQEVREELLRAGANKVICLAIAH